MTIVRALLVSAVAAAVSPVPPAQLTRVSVQVVAFGLDGRPVLGLRQDEFEIRVAGQPRAVQSFASGPAPSAVVVLFDVSASLDGVYGRGRATADLRASVDAWLAARPVSEDRWRLGSFARQVRLEAGWSQDTHSLRASAGKLLEVPDAERYGPSPVWDAADAGVSAIGTEAGRRGVIVVSDGRSTGNRLGAIDVVHHAVAAGVPVTVIGPSAEQQFALDRTSLLLVSPALALQALADETGGRYVPGLAARGRGQRASPGAATDTLASLLDQIALEIRQSYLLGFSIVTAAEAPQRLEVAIARPGVTARAQKSFTMKK